MSTIPYNPTANVGHNWKVTVKGPLDIRTVMSSKLDLLDKTKFGATGLVDYRYQGMIVSVIEDEDTNNNGIYYLQGTNPNLPESWVKIGSGDSFSWPDPPEDYDPNKRYYLDWNNGNPTWKLSPTKLSELEDVDVDGASHGDVLKYNSTTQQWEAATDERGSGSGSGVTTDDIPYDKLWADPSNGGLGHKSMVPGKDFGFLKEEETWKVGEDYITTTNVIPAGVTYQEIFKKIFDGVNISLTVNSPQDKTYNSSYQLFGDSNVQLSAPAGYSLYYRVGTSGAWAPYDSSLLKGKDAGTYTWQIRINNDDSTIQTAVLNISKATLKITSLNAEKVFDGTPLTYHNCTFSPNYGDHGLTVSYTGTGTLPGNYQNTFTTSGTLSSNYNSPSLSFGTLKILPFIQYSIQSNRISVTRDTSVQFPDGVQRKVSGQSDVYYINGRSGEVQGDTYTFKIYVAGNQVIDDTKLWFFNDSTKAWESSASDANAWGNINLSSPEIITELGATTRVYTYSNVSYINNQPIEVPFPNIYVAFKVKNYS